MGQTVPLEAAKITVSGGRRAPICPGNRGASRIDYPFKTENPIREVNSCHDRREDRDECRFFSIMLKI
jgi:hypothetical protein